MIQRHYSGRALIAREERREQIRLVLLGCGDEVVGVLDTRFAQHLRIGCIPAKYESLGHLGGQVERAVGPALNHRDSDLLAYEQSRQRRADLSRSGDDDLTGLPRLDSDRGEVLRDRLGRTDRIEQVARAQRRVAARDDRPRSAVDAGEDPVVRPVEVLQRFAVDRSRGRRPCLQQNELSVAEKPSLAGAGHARQAEDFLRDQLLGIELEDLRVVAQQRALAQVGVGDADDASRSAEASRGECREQIDRVVIRDREEQFGIVHAVVAQDLRVAAVPGDGEHVHRGLQPGNLGRVALDHDEVVSLADERLCDVDADLAGTDDENSHGESRCYRIGAAPTSA